MKEKLKQEYKNGDSDEDDGKDVNVAIGIDPLRNICQNINIDAIKPKNHNRKEILSIDVVILKRQFKFD